MERLLQRTWRFVRTLIVGGGASIVDFVVLTAGVRLLHLESLLARGVALAVSGVVLFYGSRTFAFRAQEGNAGRQLRWFIVAELVGLPLNLLAFHGFAIAARWLSPELVSLPASAVVFLAYSYPVRRLLVFRV